MLRSESQELINPKPKSTTSYGTLEIYKKQAMGNVNYIKQRLQRITDRENHHTAIRVTWNLIGLGLLVGVWAAFIALSIILGKYFMGNRYLFDYNDTKEGGRYCKDIVALKDICDWPSQYDPSDFPTCSQKAADLCTTKTNDLFQTHYISSQTAYVVVTCVIGTILTLATIFILIFGMLREEKKPILIELPDVEKAHIKEIFPQLLDDTQLSDLKGNLKQKNTLEEGKAKRLLSFFSTDEETPVRNFIERDSNLDCTNHIIKYTGLTTG